MICNGTCGRILEAWYLNLNIFTSKLKSKIKQSSVLLDMDESANNRSVLKQNILYISKHKKSPKYNIVSSVTRTLLSQIAPLFRLPGCPGSLYDIMGNIKKVDQKMQWPSH